MKRRAFLVGLATAPWFIRRAFGDASVGGVVHGSATGSASGAGYRSTRPAGPTLVLVVPRGEEGRWERGNAFGELLNKGSDRELAALATVDVVCARALDFGATGEPLALFLFADMPERRLEAVPQKKMLAAVKQFIREVAPLPAGVAVADLAARARARYVTHAPRGARWGNTGVCGVHYEEGPQGEQPDCGMAFAPERSRRFLDFYVKAS